jgi:hypothetical protein
MVRDLARSLGREVKFEIVGGATQVDRDILVQLEAPLGHLLRNAVDHGIEPAAARRAAGKPPEGSFGSKPVTGPARCRSSSRTTDVASTWTSCATPSSRDISPRAKPPQP